MQKLAGTYAVLFLLECISLRNKFVARIAELQQLDKALLPGQTTKIQCQLILFHSFGGIGKTQLAVKFAREHKGTSSAIFSLKDSSKAQVERVLVRAAELVSDEAAGARHILP